MLSFVCAAFLQEAPGAAARETPPVPVTSAAGFESFTLGGELRLRSEYRNRAAPVSGTPSAHPNSVRARVQVHAVWDEFLSAYAQLQKVVATEGSASANQLHQGFVRADQLLGAYQLTVGRFEMAMGSGRMISPQDWLLAPNTFDGVAFAGGYDLLDFALWYTQPPAGQGGLSTETDFYGGYATWAGLEDVAADLYVFRLHDGPARVDERTLGGRLTGEILRQLTWSAEGAIQGGARGGRDLGADAFILELSYAFEGGHHLGGEWSVASGDEQPRDGNDETFRAPFPDAHRFNGIADVVAWRNLDDLALRYWQDWSEKWTAHLDLHDLRRRTAADALYTGPGGAGARGTGLSSIGKEIDLYFVGDLTENVALSFGAATFLAASGIRNSEDQLWLYGQLHLYF